MSHCDHEFEVVHCSKCDAEAFYCTKCGEAEIIIRLTRLEAERDYAIKQWANLKTKYEQPTTHKEVRAEISKSLEWE